MTGCGLRFVRAARHLRAVWTRSNLDPARKSGGFGRFVRDERGSYLVLMAFLLPAMIGIVGLGTEGAYWLYNKRVLQSAADNAAFSVATAKAINSNSTSAQLLLQAEAIAANDYGLVNGSKGVVVTLNNPPLGTCDTTSQYIGNKQAYEVVITQSLSPLFSRIYSLNNVSICGRSVTIVSGGGDCVLATGTTGTVLAVTKNNLNMTLSGCGLFSDSTASNSISITGNNVQLTADSVGTAGGASISGNSKTTSNSVTTGDPPVQDPYASLAVSWPKTPTVTSPTSATAPTTPTMPGTPNFATNNANAGTCSNALTRSNNYTKAQSICSGALSAGGSYYFSKGLTITGTYSLPNNVSIFVDGGLTIATGANVTFNSGDTLAILSGGLSNKGTLSFSPGSGPYAIPFAGSWSNTGTVKFDNSNYNIGGTSATWATGGTYQFGTGTYNITAGAGWTNSGPVTFGSGNYIISAAGWSNSSTLTLGAGTYNITVSGSGLSNSGTVNFGGGSNFISVTAGGWANTGTLSFGNGTTNIGITSGGWSNSGGGTVTFGTGNYVIAAASTVAATPGWSDSGTTTFGGGTYNIGVKGDWTNSSNLNMASGTYSVSIANIAGVSTCAAGGGNWNISGSTDTIGSGTFYLTGCLNFSGSSLTTTNATIVMTGTSSILSSTGNNSAMSFSAPNNAALWNSAIAIWEPNSTVTSPNGNQLAAGNHSTVDITGVFYAPKADVQFAGNTASTDCTQIIAKSVEFTGNSISFKGSCGSGGSTPIAGLQTFGQITALVE